MLQSPASQTVKDRHLNSTSFPSSLCTFWSSLQIPTFFYLQLHSYFSVLLYIMHKCKEEIALFMNKNKFKKPRVHLGSRFVWIFVPCKLTEGGLMKKLYGIVCHVPALNKTLDGIIHSGREEGSWTHALFRIALVPQAVVTRCNFRWLTFSSQSTFNHSISNFGLFISPQTHDHQKKGQSRSGKLLLYQNN